VYAISSHALAFSAFQHDVAVLIPASSLPVPPARGAGRFVTNRLLDGVCARMDARVWEAELGAEPWTPWQWGGKLDLIRQVKALRAADPWLAAQPWDVAECVAVDLATAL